MAQTKYQGRGFVQTTGINKMSIPGLSPAQLSAINSVNISTTGPGYSAVSGLGALSGNISASGQSFNYNTISLDLSDYKRHPDVKKYEVYELPEDVMILSSTWKRLRDEGKYGNVSKLVDNELFKEITQADRQKAAEIRDYYSKKIVMWNLKGQQLTSYRKDLVKLIQGDGSILREDQFGIAYHLPAFYEYDQSFEEIRLSTSYTNLKSKSEGTVKLTPIKKMFHKTKHMVRHEYWFKTNNDEPVMLPLNVKNPLEHIWDSIFNSGKQLEIGATFIKKQIDGFEYHLVCEKWKLHG